MEQFDEALALLCATMRFSACGYVRLNEGAKRDMWSMFAASLSAADRDRMERYGKGWVPQEDAALVAAVERAASVDSRLYAQATRAFNSTVRVLVVCALGCVGLTRRTRAGRSARWGPSSRRAWQRCGAGQTRTAGTASGACPREALLCVASLSR